MRVKSIKVNAFLNTLRNVLNLLFPLITFPYISRVLQVEKLGDYNFSNSIVSYFLLIAGLGISTYAVREGTKYRDSEKNFSEFANEVLSLNFASTFASYLLLIILLFASTKMRSSFTIIAILSVQILFSVIGVEWIFSIYEEYTYITLRGIAVKVISIVLLFLFVKSSQDIYNYAAINVLSSVGANLLNFHRAKKYFSFHFVGYSKWKKHLKPAVIIFTSNIAIMIYVNSDITMLGLMKGNSTVGIYSVSVKIYSIIKNMLGSILIVTIPRMSYFWGNKMKTEFERLIQKIYDVLIVLLLPIMVGLFTISHRIILLIFGESYLKAESSLQILSISLLFSIVGWIFSQCILIPAKKEKIILIATFISAFANISLNILLIGSWGEIATSITTLISELIMMIISIYYGKQICDVSIINNNAISTIAGTCIVGFSAWRLDLTLGRLNIDNVLATIIIVLISSLLYLFILLILKNTVVLDTINNFRNIILKRQ